MTARSTDWSLAALVALLFGTGLLSLVSGHDSSAWVWSLHGGGGAALGLVVGWKLRRVWRRVTDLRSWDRRTFAGVVATGVVIAALGSGWVWSSGGDLYVTGFNLLNWHITLGVVLTFAVGLHGLLRWQPLRRTDLLPPAAQARRRQLLQLGAIGAAALATNWLQRPTAAALGWRGATRRWTGSYEAGSFQGNAFPATSWVADRPVPLSAESYRLTVIGLVRSPLSLPLSAIPDNDQITATLDCTGGFFSTQHWRGVQLQRLIAMAEPLPTGTHVRVVSITGYRWSFPLAEAATLLLASRVGAEQLAHGHGAPLRLVAPGRRGFQWIKWVVRIELHAGPDAGAAASTIWSSWTPAGRGAPDAPISQPD